MSYSFEINHKLKIIHSRLTGNLLLEEIEEAIRALYSYQEFRINRYNLIIDFRTSIFNFSISELIQAEKRIQTFANIIYNQKIAFIIDNHRNMAVTMMFSNRHLERKTILVEFFTTEESARSWAK